MKKKDSISLIIAVITLILMFIAILMLFINTEKQLYDCRFEVNHLQTRLIRCQELSDCAEALEQTLPSLAWAQVRTLNEEIKQKRRWEYERYEQPLLGN